MVETRLLDFYREHATAVLLPFWWKAVDRERGGIFTCFDNSGSRLLSRNKYTWSQGRFVWMWSRIAWMIRQGMLTGDDAEYLRQAERAADFLSRHVFLENGNCAYVLTESGERLESAPGAGYDTSIYADCFVAMGLAEYARVSGNRSMLEGAARVYDGIVARVHAGSFRTEPYPIPAGFRAHSIPMILLRVAQVLSAALRSFEDPRQRAFDADVTAYVEQILNVFRQADGRVMEMIPTGRSGSNTLLGRHLTPGHMLECMWFVIHAALEQNQTQWIPLAVESIRAALKLGWDSEFGGVFRYVDCDGGPPDGIRNGAAYENLVAETWDTKIWWPHAEALYSTLLAASLTGDRDLAASYDRLHEYVFRTFPHPDPNIGEWIQIRDREGRPLDKVVALPVKDPYHILQDVLLIIEMLYARKPSALDHGPAGQPSG